MRQHVLRLFLLVLVVTVAACNYVKEQFASELPTINVTELAAGLQSKSVHIFDNNRMSVYKESHIPTAVHMDTRNPDVSLLPADKDAALVFYCKNEMCMASHKGARFGLEQGYRNVRVLAAGIDGWMDAGQPVESAN